MQTTISKYSLFILFNLFCTFHLGLCRDVLIVSPSPSPEQTEECDVFCYNNKNVSLSCNLIDCNIAVNVSSIAPSAPGFTTSDVSYYIYNASLQENHLALNTKWTFKYDQTLPWITGYRARLTYDDVLLEEVCIDISRTLKADDVKTYFSYNCFGRHDVHLEPNKKYQVEIASLPLSTQSHSLTKVDFTMPECVVDEVYKVAECNLTPVSKEFSTDCSSIADGKYPVDCQVLAINQKAADVLQFDFPLGKNGPPSSPSVVQADQQWYTFYHSESKTVRIALNVSWSPSDDSSIGQLRAYNVQVLPLSLSPSAFSIYNISTPLTFAEHIKVEFLYDYFGRDLHTVEPGTEYNVIITSLPRPETYDQTPLYINVKIPGCEDQRLQHVTYCKEHNPAPIAISVDEVFCYNRSIQLTYNAPTAYGNVFTRLFCKLDRNQLSSNCHVLSDWQLYSNRETLYDIRLPPKEQLNQTYFVSIRSNENPHLQSYRSQYFNFTKCIEELKPINSTPTYIIAIAVCGVITICCLSIILFIMRQKSRAKYQDNPVPMSMVETMVNTDNQHSSINGKETKPPAVNITEKRIEGGHKVRVFVVYTNDCEQHLNVMHHFCSFLRQDLQLDVNTYVWERNEAKSNPLPWMMNNFDKANKVLVICSEGSKHSLTRNQAKIDHFAPVVKRIIDHNFMKTNMGKYLYGYFDYSSEDHIPDQLKETSAVYCSQFKLMKQFEELYFRLINREQYQEGKIMRIEKIGFDQYDISPQNNHGYALKQAIDKMSRYVELNPTWFTDQHGDEMPVSTYPLMPTREERSISYVPSLPSVQMSYQPIETEGEEMASIQKLSIIAPPDHNAQEVDVEKKQQQQSSMQPQSDIMKPVKSSPHLNKRPLSADLDEDFSIHPKRKQTTCIGREPESTIPLLQAPSSRTPVENYCQQGEPLVCEVPKRLNDPPSHMVDYPEPQTMETILPIFDEPPDNIQGSDFTDSFHPDSFIVDFQGGSFQDKLAPTELNLDSGVFTLAQMDDDDIDIDDEFQSINQTSMGQFRDI